MILSATSSGEPTIATFPPTAREAAFARSSKPPRRAFHARGVRGQRFQRAIDLRSHRARDEHHVGVARGEVDPRIGACRIDEQLAPIARLGRDVRALQPPAWIGRNSPSMSGCANARATGLSENAAGEAMETKGVDATEDRRGSATGISLKTDTLGRFVAAPGAVLVDRSIHRLNTRRTRITKSFSAFQLRCLASASTRQVIWIAASLG